MRMDDPDTQEITEPTSDTQDSDMLAMCFDGAANSDDIEESFVLGYN